MVDNSLVVLKKKTIVDYLTDIVLCMTTFISIIMLMMCLIIIAKKILFPTKVPDIFGIKPFIVLSESMEPEINKGDLVFIKEIKAEYAGVGDIIAFRHSKEDIITLHRILDKETKENTISFRTKGDSNEDEDRLSVKEQEIEGIYFKKIAKIGYFAMLMREPKFACCLVLTVLTLFLVWKIVKIKNNEKILNKRLNEYRKIIDELRKESV